MARNCFCNPTVGDGPSYPCDCNGGGLLGPPIQQPCAQRIAPIGFKYRLINGDCVLVSASSGMPVIPFVNSAAVVVNPVESLKNWAIANPLLSLGIAGGLYYLFTKK